MQITEKSFVTSVRPSSPIPPITSVARDGIAGKERISSGVRSSAPCDSGDENGRSVPAPALSEGPLNTALNVDIANEAVLPSDIAIAILRFYRRQMLRSRATVPLPARSAPGGRYRSRISPPSLLHLQQRDDLANSSRRRIVASRFCPCSRFRLQIGELQLAFAHQITDAMPARHDDNRQ